MLKPDHCAVQPENVVEFAASYFTAKQRGGSRRSAARSSIAQVKAPNEAPTLQQAMVPQPDSTEDLAEQLFGAHSSVGLSWLLATAFV